MLFVYKLIEFLNQACMIAKPATSYEGSCLPANINSVFTIFLAFQSQLLTPI